MGICESGDAPPPPLESNDSLLREETSYIIHLINSSNIPTKGVDVLDGIQAYCKIKVKTCDEQKKPFKPTRSDSSGTIIDRFTECKTTIRHSSDEPAWNCYRKIIASKNDIIHIELYDEDWFIDDFLGVATLEITSDLEFNEMIEIPFVMLDQFKDYDANIRLKIYKEIHYHFTEKRIYFIRHGKSEFNEALEKTDLVQMWSKTDHPLTERGIAECEILNNKIKNKHADTDDVDDFLSVDGIWTSPLCRAVQTTFIALHQHPILMKSGMLLLSNCREFKSIGGRDSTGNKLGVNIRNRCFDKLKKYRDDQYIDKYKQIAWDFNDTCSKWWSGIDDKRNKEVNERFADFVDFVRYRPEKNVIIVTHSVFIRYFFKRYLPKKDDMYYDDLFNQKYETNYFNDDVDNDVNDTNNDDIDHYEKLSTYKLENGGCLRVDIQCDDCYRDGIIVKDTKLMFGSILQQRGKKQSK